MSAADKIPSSRPSMDESLTETRTPTIKDVAIDVEKRDLETPEHVQPKRSTLRSVLLVATCTLAMLINISAGTSASIALPTIGAAFGTSQDDLQWFVSAFSLSGGCFLILFGRLADLHGRKKAFLIGSAWLCIFSIACGFAQNTIALAILRALQGMGPAATIPASLGILAHAFPPSKARSIAFATFSAGAPMGGAIGFVFGGILTQFATWRAIFWFMAGLCAISFTIALFVMDADVPSTEKDRRVDWLGAFLVTAGLALLIFVLGQGELAPDGWKTGYIIGLLITSVVFLAAFIAWEKYLQDHTEFPPLMPLTIWTRGHGKFAVMQLIAFFEWSGFLSWAFWATIYYQSYREFTPMLTVVRFLPMTVTGILCNVAVALVIGRLPVHYLVAIGCTLTAIAPLLFAIINNSAPYWAFGFPAAIVAVFGADFVFASGTIFVAKVALPHEQSLAGALFNTLTQLGTAFGLAVSTIVHDKVVKSNAVKEGFNVAPDGSGAPKEAQMMGYRAAQWTAFAFPILAALMGVIFLRGVGIVGHSMGGGHEPETNENEKKVRDEDKDDGEASAPQTHLGSIPSQSPNTIHHNPQESVMDEKTREEPSSLSPA
ncbi:putative efflux transporter [Sistotremastrum niveocremeum HHB9708]|uniref:Putative efflux transporter n=1 Tax=Sistotremastrum niveocremeum HHB9708 TaxID=1314777 RepID=A0A164T0P5_9AGAM|nr:putative efflux transporter [Sistotremastrum niveocremeum HHB9708]